MADDWPAQGPIAIDARKLGDFGIGTYLRNLLQALAALDGPERYLLLEASSSEPLELGPRFGHLRLTAPGYSLAEQWQLPLACVRAGASLLHVPHYVLPAAAGLPTVVTIHDLIHLHDPQQLGHPLRALAARLLLRQAASGASRILTVSQASRRDLIDWLAIEPQRIEVVPNAVDPRLLEPPDEAQLSACARAWRLAAEPLVYVGNLKPHKNLPRLLEAWSGLGQAAPMLVLAGFDARHPEARQLLEQVERRGLGSRLRLVGFVSMHQLAALYRLATAVVFPSLYEGFGLPLLEAQACGTPVLAGDIAVLREVGGGAAEYADPRSPEALRRGLERVLGDVRLRARLREQGLANARRYSWSRAARAVRELYRRLLCER